MTRGTSLLLRVASLLAIPVAVAAAPVSGAGKLSATGAWIRETPPGRTVGAGYVELRNSSDAPISLVAASSDGAERVEFHTHSHEDGMMRMRRVESVEVPAHGAVAFAPGGLHLMLFGTGSPRAGARLEIEFETADGDRLAVNFPVRSDADTPGVMR